MKRHLHGIPFDDKVSDIRHEGRYLPKPKLATIKRELIVAMMGTFRQFRKSMNDGDVSQRFCDMFAPFMDTNDVARQDFFYDISILNDQEFNELASAIQKRLTRDVKLYYNRVNDYTLIIPLKRTLESPKIADHVECENLRYYNFAVQLFRETQLAHAEQYLCDDAIQNNAPSRTDSADGTTYKTHWYQFSTEKSLVDFINDTLPLGHKLSISGNIKRCH